jgi:deazaflavin-dependent oxidoreductase (nitroreductase family)
MSENIAQPEQAPETPTSPAEFNAQVIRDFRANNGHVGGQFEKTPLLLLHHTGARSGTTYINPLGYLYDDGRYVVFGVNAGAPGNPAWYYNLKAHPHVTVEAAGGTIDVTASEAIGAERDRLFKAALEHFPARPEHESENPPPLKVIVLTPAQRG